MIKMDDLRIRQLDEMLAPFAPLRRRPPPPAGWVRTVREALGLSLRQMAEHTGISKTSITSAEAGEARGTVQMDTLRRLADALECNLVYALVPRTSLANTLEAQARRKAAGVVGRVADSMTLEAQGVEPEESERQIEELSATLLRERGRDFWDV